MNIGPGFEALMKFGHSVPEIAETLEIPLNTAYSRLRLARQEYEAAVRRLRAQRGEG